MEKKLFNLGHRDDSLPIRIFQLLLGYCCIGLAIFWLVLSMAYGKASGNAWFTEFFLTVFGGYQVLAGLGKTRKYIEINTDTIYLKQNSLLPGVLLNKDNLARIEVFPLSVNFHLVNNKIIILRFGLLYTGIINPVKESLIGFAGANGIHLEEKREDV
jgi:hypothetical protein